MYRLSRLRFLFPLGLFICFFLDGSLSKIFANQFFSYPYLMVSQLVVLWLIFGAFFEEDIQIPLTGFAVAAGICADLYYSGILGLFMFLYPGPQPLLHSVVFIPYFNFLCFNCPAGVAQLLGILLGGGDPGGLCRFLVGYPWPNLGPEPGLLHLVVLAGSPPLPTGAWGATLESMRKI